MMPINITEIHNLCQIDNPQMPIMNPIIKQIAINTIFCNFTLFIIYPFLTNIAI